MITLLHMLFDLLIVYGATYVIEVRWLDIVLILSVNLIDLDHFWSKPVYKSGRNSFKTHYLHRRWRYLLVLALGLLFFRPVMFLGVGLISHMLLDYLDSRETLP